MFSERVYRWLLIVYPREHRRQYGALMVQLFRDRMRRDGKSFRGLTVLDSHDIRPRRCCNSKNTRKELT